MSRLSLDGEAAGAVEGQIRLGKDHRVDVVVIDGLIGPAVGQGILRSLRQGHKYLIRLQGVDGGGSGTGDIRPGQHQLDLVRVPRVDHDLSLRQGSGEEEGSRVGDGHPAAVNSDRVGGTGSSLPVEFNRDCRALVIGACQIPVAEQPVRIHHRGTGSIR